MALIKIHCDKNKQKNTLHIIDINPPAPVEHPVKKRRRKGRNKSLSKKSKGGDRKRLLRGATVKVFSGTAVLLTAVAASSASPSTAGDLVWGVMP